MRKSWLSEFLRKIYENYGGLKEGKTDTLKGNFYPKTISGQHSGKKWKLLLQISNAGGEKWERRKNKPLGENASRRAALHNSYFQKKLGKNLASLKDDRISIKSMNQVLENVH